MVQASGGWCAPPFLEVSPPFDLAAYRERWPVGGPCSECDGSGTQHVGPSCPCPTCEREVKVTPCWGCGGSGIEQDNVALIELDGQPLRVGVGRHVLSLPEISVNRGGIQFPL